jgi:hypothetical protein
MCKPIPKIVFFIPYTWMNSLKKKTKKKYMICSPLVLFQVYFKNEHVFDTLAKSHRQALKISKEYLLLNDSNEVSVIES